MIAPMSRLELVGPAPRIDATLSTLQRLGVMQIDEMPLSGGDDSGLLRSLALDEQRLAEREGMRTILRTIEETLTTAAAQAGEADDDAPAPSVPAVPAASPALASEIASGDWQDLERQVNDAAGHIESLLRRSRNAAEDLLLLQRFQSMLQRFQPSMAEIEHSSQLEYLGITLTRSDRDTVNRLRLELARVAGHDARVLTGDSDDGPPVAVVAFAASHAAPVKDLLWQQGISELRLPSQLQSMSMDDTLAALAGRISELQSEVSVAQGELRAALAERRQLLAAARVVCGDRLAYFESLAKAATTRYAFVLTGWAPRSEVATLEAAIEQELHGTVAVQVLADQPDDDPPPVVLRNNPLARPFEMFIRFFGSLPQYATVDPTPVMALFFPLFFGMILGDVFYGVLVLALGLVLRLAGRGQVIRSVGAIVLFAGVSTVLFGILYGEVLGDVGTRLGLHAVHPLLHREEAIVPSLVIAVGLGALHILLAYGLGIVSAARRRHSHLAIERACELIGVAALGVLLAAMLGLVPRAGLPIGLLTLVAALAIMFALHNFLAPLELIKTVGNILSYARIMAVGLSSVIIASVANQLARAAGDVVVGIVIAVALHTVNLALGIFSPTVHAARLHYVEFFGKFYESGGRAFMPFRHERSAG